MANPKGTPKNLKPAWEAGASPNPGGKPVGARNRLQGRFIAALADDFDRHGAAAVAAMREKDPSGYIRVIASLMPKEVEIGRVLEGLTDDELAAGISVLLALAEVEAKDETGGGLH
jgi:hypothetical protein